MASTPTSEFQQRHTTRARRHQPAHRIESSAMKAPTVKARRDESSATRRNETNATIGIVQQRGNRAGGGTRMGENEKRVESEPSGSSVLCEGTAVVGSVGGLRGNERSAQLSGETATQEQWCRGGTLVQASRRKQYGNQMMRIWRSSASSMHRTLWCNQEYSCESSSSLELQMCTKLARYHQISHPY